MWVSLIRKPVLISLLLRVRTVVQWDGQGSCTRTKCSFETLAFWDGLDRGWQFSVFSIGITCRSATQRTTLQICFLIIWRKGGSKTVFVLLNRPLGKTWLVFPLSFEPILYSVRLLFQNFWKHLLRRFEALSISGGLVTLLMPYKLGFPFKELGSTQHFRFERYSLLREWSIQKQMFPIYLVQDISKNSYDFLIFENSPFFGFESLRLPLINGKRGLHTVMIVCACRWWDQLLVNVCSVTGTQIRSEVFDFLVTVCTICLKPNFFRTSKNSVQWRAFVGSVFQEISGRLKSPAQIAWKAHRWKTSHENNNLSWEILSQF